MPINYRNGTLEQIFAELRFKPITDFSSIRYRVAEALEERFPQQMWKADLKILRLDAPSGTFMEFFDNRAIIQIGEELSFTAFEEPVKQCVHTLKEIAGLVDLERVGMRTNVAYSVDKPEEAVSFLRDNLFKPRRQQLKVWGEGPDRLEIGFGTRLGATHFMVRISPAMMRKEHVEISPGSSRQQVIEERFALMTDIDIFRGPCRIEEIDELLEHVKVTLTDRLPSFLRDLQEVN